MEIYESVYLGVDNVFDYGLVRGNNGRIYYHVDSEFGRGDGEGVEYKDVDEIGSVDVISHNKCDKGVKGKVGLEVCDSICLCVDKGIGSEVGSAIGITFVINDGYEMSCSDECFSGINDRKSLGSLLDVAFK